MEEKFYLNNESRAFGLFQSSNVSFHELGKFTNYLLHCTYFLIPTVRIIIAPLQ